MPCRPSWTSTLAALCAALLSACSTAPELPRPPLPLVPAVDLAKFAGDWYVIANIPTIVEKGAHNAKESYVLAPDGAMDTVFSYNANSFDGPRRSYRSRGVMMSDTNAVWGQQYLWPFKADYRISYLASDYSQTIIAREKRDYVWILARTPSISDTDYQRLVGLIGQQGYDTALIQRVPQQGALP